MPAVGKLLCNRQSLTDCTGLHCCCGMHQQHEECVHVTHWYQMRCTDLLVCANDRRHHLALGKS
jgi:hypothetical protein